MMQSLHGPTEVLGFLQKQDRENHFRSRTHRDWLHTLLWVCTPGEGDEGGTGSQAEGRLRKDSADLP